VNILLFDSAEVELPLPRTDERARHLLGVLRRQAGDTFDAGLVNGPRGRGTVAAITATHLHLSFVWGGEPPALCPLHLLVGLPLPQTARDVLREAASLGVASLRFVVTDKGEASYAHSSLWHSGEWRACLLKGTAQAFCTRLPEVPPPDSLDEALAALPTATAGFALDNYEAPLGLSQAVVPTGAAVALAIGSERGWSDRERQRLRAAGFAFVHLGARVLRTETAAIAAVTVLKAKLGWL
jgi:16S rRNA (uracil1498-N3)-methyltransferase